MNNNQSDLNFKINLENSTDTPILPIQNVIPQTQQQSSQPGICILTIFFKISAIVIYFVFGLFSSQNNLIFITVVLLGAFDFWVVKNVTGRFYSKYQRKLVGLRWWQDFDDSGKETYYFESYDENFMPNIVDSATFWNSQIVVFLVWVIVSFFDLISLKIYWMICSFAQVLLVGFNLWAFYQCRGDHQKKLQDLKSQGINAIINNQQFKDVSMGYLQNTLDSFMTKK